MVSTTAKNIMDYVKDFITQAGEEEWDTDFTLKTWEEKQSDIEAMIKVNQPKKEKKSSPKDPNKPKRGRSAYIFFCSDTRAEVKRDLGDVKPQEVMKELGVRWRAMKDSQDDDDLVKVEKYNKMAETDKKRAAEEMETYVPPTTDEIAATKTKKSRKSSSKDSDKPKRARSAYNYYCSTNRARVKEENTDVDAREITRILSNEWKELKDDEDRSDELQRYLDMASDDKVRYEKEMETHTPSEEVKPKIVKKTSKSASDGFKKFCKTNRKELKDDNPDLKPPQITKLLKEAWGELDESEKQEWEDSV
jgi:hypothetical protein